MKRILSSLLVALTLLVVGGVFTTSCSNEIISTQRVDNTPHAFTIKLSAGLGAIQADQLGEIDNPNDTRASAVDETFNFNYKIIDGQVKMTGDNGFPTNVAQKTGQLNRELFIKLNPKVKLLTVVRAKNRPTQVYYDYSEWRYDKLSDLYIKDYLSIPLSAGFQLSDEIEVRLALGGHTQVSEDGKTCSIDMYDNLYKQIDLGDAAATQNIEMPIPYISGWETLEYDASTSQMMLANADKKVVLNPQGVLFLVTMRNNMEKDLSISGLRIVSNALDFEGEFHLEGDKVRFDRTFRSVTRLDMRSANDLYRRKEFTFTNRLALTKNNTRNPYDFNHAKVLVIWVMPDGTPGGYNWGNRGSGLQTAQTHVYALDVQDAAGQEITKPNYQILPIMGTVNTLTPGKSFTLNCEFYTQPEQILGHLAKYPVNAQGDGFVASHDDDKTDLVNWKVAKDFLKGGKSITLPNGQKNTYKMIEDGFINLLGIGSYSFNFLLANANRQGYDPITTGVDGEKGRLRTTNGEIALGLPLHEQGKTTISTPWGRRTMTYIPDKKPEDDKYIAYRLVGHGMSGKRSDASYMRSPDLSIIRVEADLADNVIHQYYTSVYLGKYWVGNLFTPILDDITLTSKRFWNNPMFTRNKVERRLPAPGLYAVESLTASDSDSPVPANASKIWIGQRAVFWGRASFMSYHGLWLMTMLNRDSNPNRFTGEELTSKMLTDYRGSYFGYPLAAFPDGGRSNMGWDPHHLNQNRQYLFLPLIVYSDTYQGDSAD